MTAANQGASQAPTIFFEQYRATRLLTGAIWIAAAGWWFATIASEFTELVLRIPMIALCATAFAVIWWRYGRRRRLVLGPDGLHLSDKPTLPWQDIADIEASPDGTSILVFLFMAPSLNGNRFAADPVSRVPITIRMDGWSSSPSAVISGVKMSFAAHLADREAHRGSGDSYRPDVPDPDDSVDPDPRHVLHDLTVSRSGGSVRSAVETFKKPTEPELMSLIGDLPPGSTLRLQHGRDTEYTLRLVRVGATYTIESRQGGGTQFRTGPQMTDSAAMVALSWARGESEWRHLVAWNRLGRPQRLRSR
jgi:hypothetical protein